MDPRMQGLLQVVHGDVVIYRDLYMLLKNRGQTNQTNQSTMNKLDALLKQQAQAQAQVPMESIQYSQSVMASQYQLTITHS